MNKKIFRGAILESILLNLINDTSECGLYPELKQLEKKGLLASSWEFDLGKARRQYRITRKGQGLLREYFMVLKTVIPTFGTYKP
ncbi:MAG: helix-turn-helix transcriptional regulator [Candidatus Bathyarchaeia archaeon]